MDYDTIIRCSPEYIYNQSLEEKKQEFINGGFSKHIEFAYYNDTIIWMYLLSLLEQSDEISAKNKFSEEFLKCENYFMQESPDCYLHITYVFDLFAQTPEELRTIAEALSMVFIKSDNILDIVPAISSCYAVLEDTEKNQYYINLVYALNDFRLIVNEDEKTKRMDEIEAYYSSVKNAENGNTTLSKDEMLLLIDKFDETYNVEKIQKEIKGELTCRKDVCIIYSESQEYRIAFYGIPIQLVGLENKLTGELISYKILK